MGNQVSAGNPSRYKIILPTLDPPEFAPPEPLSISIIERSKRAVQSMLKCISLAISHHIDDRQTDRRIGLFDEKLHPLTKAKIPDNYDDINPDHKKIYKFIQKLFNSPKLTGDYAVIALIYIERLMANMELELTPCNWKRITTAAVLLASKTWDDQVGLNGDVHILKKVIVLDLEELEEQFLKKINFNTFVTLTEYTQYYKDLHKLAEENNLGYLSAPLSEESALRLRDMLKL